MLGTVEVNGGLYYYTVVCRLYKHQANMSGDSDGVPVICRSNMTSRVFQATRDAYGTVKSTCRYVTTINDSFVLDSRQRKVAE